MPSDHTIFVNSTKAILLERLAFSSSLPVGVWQNRGTRPDVLVLQEPSFGRAQVEGKRNFQGFYTQAYMVECKIDSEDLKKSAYQLLLAVVEFSGLGMLDLNHGGLRPSLAIPTTLRDSMQREGSFDRAVSVYRELNFGLFIVDLDSQDFEWVLPPGSFMAR